MKAKTKEHWFSIKTLNIKQIILQYFVLWAKKAPWSFTEAEVHVPPCLMFLVLMKNLPISNLTNLIKVSFLQWISCYMCQYLKMCEVFKGRRKDDSTSFLSILWNKDI